MWRLLVTALEESNRLRGGSSSFFVNERNQTRLSRPHLWWDTNLSSFLHAIGRFESCLEFPRFFRVPSIHEPSSESTSIQLILFDPATDYTTVTFSWPEYLAKTGGIEAPSYLFKQVSNKKYLLLTEFEVRAVTYGPRIRISDGTDRYNDVSNTEH